MAPPGIAEVAPATETHSAIYRCAASKDGFPELGVATLYEAFDRSCKQFSGLPALGHRPIGPDGAAGDFAWLTYGETGERVARLASALAGFGLAAKDRVAVYGANSPEWMMAMQACNRMSYECVPLYDSLGENAIEFILRHSEAAAVFVAGGKAGKLAAALGEIKAKEGEEGEALVKSVIYWGDAPDAALLEKLQGLGLEVLSWEAALEAGAAAPAEPVPPSADDYCTIMYTSGTTGDPKGVLLKHSAVVAAVANVTNYCQQWGQTFGPGDSMLSYLPLAHIFDRW
ncbi:hypothetical protein Rsub_09440, partial [Raphidocelis subcapitata]